jgi:hypothetical protein
MLSIYLSEHSWQRPAGCSLDPPVLIDHVKNGLVRQMLTGDAASNAQEILNSKDRQALRREHTSKLRQMDPTVGYKRLATDQDTGLTKRL